jgi:uncharacterized protein (TIGR00304 family)
MHLRILAPPVLFFGGVVCIAAAVLSGSADVSLFIVFPVFSGSSGLFVLGTALIVFSFIAGFAFLMMGQFEMANASQRLGEDVFYSDRQRKDSKFGGVILVGPVPIAFGSDYRTALTMLVVGIIAGIVAITILFVLLQ